MCTFTEELLASVHFLTLSVICRIRGIGNQHSQGSKSFVSWLSLVSLVKGGLALGD